MLVESESSGSPSLSIVFKRINWAEYWQRLNFFLLTWKSVTLGKSG